MARRKRNAKGQFVKRGGTTRRKTTRKRTTTRRRRRTTTTTPRRRRRSYRRNPPRLKPLKRLMEGARGALGVTVGKAAARAIPQQIGLPTTGTMGIATMLGTALVVGMIADKVARKDAPFIVAGALTAPIEGLVRSLKIPVLSPALSGVRAYPQVRSGGPSQLGVGLASWGPAHMEV